MARPSRHVLLTILLAAVLPLAACGSDPETETAGIGDIVIAKAGVDTSGAPKGFLMLPSGRLDVRAGKPVASVDDDQTRERNARTAPDGGVLVPFTWSFSTVEMEKLSLVFGRPLPIEMTLVSDGEPYPLAAPSADRDGQNAVAYYVAVDGAGNDLQLEVEYGGVTQTLDLVSGDRAEGRAKALYDLDPSEYSEKLRPCDSDEWAERGPLEQITFSCTRTDAVVSPFIDGTWAPEGTIFAAVGLATDLSAYSAYQATGGGASYVAVSSKEKSELAGERPTRVIDGKGRGGFSAGFLVFTVEGEVPPAVMFRRTYELQRSAVLGDIDAPYSRTLDITGRLPLD